MFNESISWFGVSFGCCTINSPEYTITTPTKNKDLKWSDSDGYWNNSVMDMIVFLSSVIYEETVQCHGSSLPFYCKDIEQEK